MDKEQFRVREAHFWVWVAGWQGGWRWGAGRAHCGVLDVLVGVEGERT